MSERRKRTGAAERRGTPKLHTLLVLMLGGGAWLSGCQDDPVQRELDDLDQAREHSPKVVQELTKQLEKERADVARVEQKLALAKRGITDEVLEEREELEQALEQQGEQVKETLEEHEREVERVQGVLERTSPEVALDQGG